MSRKIEQYQAVWRSPYGLLGIAAASRVSGMEFMVEDRPEMAPTTAMAEQVIKQLERYFDDPQWCFELPMDETGTDYQRRVWAALRAIPPGQVRRYGELAGELHSSARAIGGACRRNPMPVITPCHRVVAAQGLGGFAGDTSGRMLDWKRDLLRHEGIATSEICNYSVHSTTR